LSALILAELKLQAEMYLGEEVTTAVIAVPANFGFYLLVELLYDVGPITKIGPSENEKSNSQVLSGNQINNEEDQEDVASALHCDRLLTCDDAMHRIADAFTQAGYWKGICIHIPPDEVDKLDRHFS
jgi:hypothetical protein